MFILKSFFLVVLTLLVSFTTIAQINFEKGFIITENDQRLEVYIKNQDWKSNPSSIEYKTKIDGDKKIISLAAIKEFEIFNTSKYLKSEVEIDQSPIKINDLNYNKNPNFKKVTVLLKVLIDGQASLYKYEIGDNIKYFFKTENSEIKQLIFKKYLFENNRQIKENKQFQQQLYNALQCEAISRTRISNLDYRKRDLTKIFKDYNKCKNPDYEPKFNDDQRKLLHLNITPGISFAATEYQIAANNFPFEDQTSFRIGAELEYILPFNKNKWSLSFEPSYQTINTSTRLNSNNPLDLTYSYLDFTLAARHYFFLTENSKLFLNAGYVASISLNGEFSNFKISNTSNFMGGAGFKFKNKYGLEVRYLTSRNLLLGYSNYSIDYKTISLIFSYTLF